ncbi:toxin-antitoxin system HicB family antitoxin [Actinomadura roseirufa]|uniref:toxin-antitoxin system HicB family antitoxin n=1 Tax=Actinomadura roseirufa TaxID=2094049 RepID=UPI001041A3B2|nr:toxin-antitoxin system HicB family antitoxin [Actinomadura roseirufa]
MTTRSVRIPPEIDGILTKAAEAEHISVNAAIVQAVQTWALAREHRAHVQAITAQVMAEDAALLERLADA